MSGPSSRTYSPRASTWATTAAVLPAPAVDARLTNVTSFAEALASWAERFRSDVTEAYGKTSTRRLKTAYRRAVRAFELHPPVYGHLVVLQASKDPLAADLFEQFSQRRSAVFASFLPGVESPAREDIVAVMSAVLDANLRDWSRGRQPISAVYSAVDRAAELLLP